MEYIDLQTIKTLNLETIYRHYKCFKIQLNHIHKYQIQISQIPVKL